MLMSLLWPCGLTDLAWPVSQEKLLKTALHKQSIHRHTLAAFLYLWAGDLRGMMEDSMMPMLPTCAPIYPVCLPCSYGCPAYLWTTPLCTAFPLTQVHCRRSVANRATITNLSWVWRCAECIGARFLGMPRERAPQHPCRKVLYEGAGAIRGED